MTSAAMEAAPAAVPWRWPASASRHRWLSLAAICAFALLLRILLSLHSYSGAGVAPKYGDYEAQRHWMEITVHTPVKQWYTNTTDNDLRYWGLDYPPLTAYQSWLHGRIIYFLDPAAVALNSSRGYEDARSKFLMRWTVLSSDILVFFPAAIAFVASYYRRRRFEEQAWALGMILLQPALMLIDHGHFQFNCISLGLAAGAAVAVVSRHELIASVLYCLSLNHKQMSAYYAPAFFAHLLGRCFQRRSPVFGVVKLGIVVLTTFTICWWPFLSSRQSALQVLSRLAPFERGLFEDYVANFWCGTSMLIKWKQRFSIPVLARMALGATVTAALPSMLQQIWAPSARGFLLAMLNGSFAFFFFAFQVHEKSVLLPLLPATLLALEEPEVLQYLVPYAVISMFPLLRRDDLILPYFTLLALFFLLPKCPARSSNDTAETAIDKPFKFLSSPIFKNCSIVGAVILHLLYLYVQPPARYPFLFEAFLTSYSFAHFLVLVIYTNCKQWLVPADDQWVPSSKKIN